MAISNHERVGKALELVKDGLRPFVERELKARDAQGWLNIVRALVRKSQARLFTRPPIRQGRDLAVMWNQWNEVFRRTLGPAERSLVSELRSPQQMGAPAELLQRRRLSRARFRGAAFDRRFRAAGG